MATDNNTLTTGIGTEESFGVSMGDTGTEALFNDGTSFGVDDDADNQEDLNEDLNGAGDESNDGDDDQSNEEVTLEDLGDFDPANAEAWDAQYKTADGKLNEAALSAEFWKSGDKKSLNEGTYKYLESLGVSRTMAKNVEAALVTKHDADTKAVAGTDAELFTLAGGPDALQAALQWGKNGGYSKEAVAKFDKVMKGKDPEAKKEAVELLMARHNKANPTSSKPRLPKRDATKGQGQPQGLKPFANREEYREARKAAGSNQQARRQVAERLARSSF